MVLEFLQYHNKNSDILSQDFGWGDKEDEGSSFARHLKKKKKIDIKASNTNPLTKHPNGVVAFGRR